MDGRALLAAALSLPLALAGCAADAGIDTVSFVPVGPMEPLLVPADRPVAAATRWHEEVTESPRDDVALAGNGFILENSWEPRDVELTYHGVQDVYDEWGRAVPAHVFRYPTMDLAITDIELLADLSVEVTARYEPGLVEHAFDAADGRYLGALDVKHQARSFDDTRYPLPYAADYSADLMLPIAYLALGGDLSKPLEMGLGTVSYAPTDLKPLAGDCTPYEVRLDYADWYEQWVNETSGGDPVAEVTPEEEPMHVVCLQARGEPLWVYSGNTTDNLVLRRLGGAMPPLALEGAARAPDGLAVYPMEEMPMLVGLANPVLVPPSAYPGDWADQVRPVTAALPTNLDYLQWQREREPLYVTLAHLGLPFLDLVPLGLPMLEEGVLFDRTSWVFVGDGDAVYWGFVDSRYGGPEDPDLHVSQRGFAIDDYRTTMQDSIASGEVQARWEVDLPSAPRLIMYTTLSALGDAPPEFWEYLAPFLRLWAGLEYCFEERDGGRYGLFSGFNGQMLSAGLQASTAEGCSSGVGDDGFLPLSWGRQGFLLRAPTPGSPGLLLMPDLGLALPFAAPPPEANRPGA